MFSQDEVVQFATRSLLYEAVTNPKPGLVDPQSSGAHTDMDIFTFIDSSTSLTQYFNESFAISSQFNGDNLQELFSNLRIAGIEAEKSMFSATSGINTHKGAIFSLGVLVAAYSYTTKHLEMTISETVKEMLKDLTKNDFSKVNEKSEERLTAGEKQFLKYGTKGIRGEAEAGFPTVFKLSLPYLRSTSGNKNERLLDTLMKIAQVTDDSNLIKRAGTTEILPWIQNEITKYFELGGASTKVGKKYLYDLDRTFIDRNLSLGGSADLLILTVFLGMLEGII